MSLSSHGTANGAISYLDRISASTAGGTFKRELIRLLDLRPGQVALDVGCGPGSDLAGMRERVGPEGRTIGVDRNPEMCAEARRRLGFPDVRIMCADAHALPLSDGSVDRARAERVLMHVADPARALADLRRVVRQNGLITLAEPDWDTLVIDHPDQEVSRTYTRFVSQRLVRHGSIGRQLVRLCEGAGFEVRLAVARTVVHRSFASAREVWDVDAATECAVAQGQLDGDTAREWLDHLHRRSFFGSITFFVVAASAR